MRKKIPAITRPDPAYAASLRPEVEEDPGREEVRRAQPIPEPETVRASSVESAQPTVQIMPPMPPPRPSRVSATGIAAPPTGSPSRIRRNPATRKIDVRVNALERQEDALIDCGVDPAHVIRAALRRSVKNWELGPDFVPPSEEPRSRITEWRARTSLAVDAGALTALLHAHDPLDVLSKWTLVRGQLEPRVWAEIDELLDELRARNDPSTDGPSGD